MFKPLSLMLLVNLAFASNQPTKAPQSETQPQSASAEQKTTAPTPETQPQSASAEQKPTAPTPETQPQSASAEPAPAAPKQDEFADMLSLNYADDSRCTIKNSDGSQYAVLPLLVSADGLEGVKHEMVIKALDDTLIKRKCDIHAPDHEGLSALNGAIMFNNADMVRYLLEHGADPKRLIERKDSLVDGKNSFEFLELLKERDPTTDRSNVQSALNEYR